MNLLHSNLLTWVSLVVANSLLRDISGDTVTVQIEGDGRPTVGDSAEISFILVDADVAVESSKVEAVGRLSQVPGAVASEGEA